MRIASKLILLTTLSVAMIAFQFGVNHHMNLRMREYINSILQLNRVNDFLLTAITEEKNFINGHKKSSLENAVKNVWKAQEELGAIGDASMVESADLPAFNDLLTKYRTAVTRLGKSVTAMDGFENQFNDGITTFNDKAESVLQMMGEEIGTKVVNMEEVPESLRSLMDITRQVTFLMSQMYLTLNHDLLLKDDLDAYIERSGKIYAELVKEKKNAIAISAFSFNEAHTSFVDKVLVRIIDKFPEWSSGIREAWKETTAVAAEIEDIRGQLNKAKNRIIITCKGRMADFGTVVLWANLVTLIFGIVTVSGLGILILKSIARPIKWNNRISRPDSQR